MVLFDYFHPARYGRSICLLARLASSLVRQLPHWLLKYKICLLTQLHLSGSNSMTSSTTVMVTNLNHLPLLLSWKTQSK